MADVPIECLDRRRWPRFLCGGQVRIVSLPFDSAPSSGRLRDLSLGGCGIETLAPLACGLRTEILVRANLSSFRAVGRVRALRLSSGVGVEFLQLSAGGQDILAELVHELARQRAIASALRASRRAPDARLLNRGRHLLLNAALPMVGAAADEDTAGENPMTTESPVLLLEGEVDLFI